MTDPLYLEQEAFLRYTLRRFLAHVGERARNQHQTNPSMLVHYNDIDSFIKKQPRSVVSLILDDRGNVLAVTRRHKPEDLGLPGGKIDPGETPERAVIRETEQETGIIIQDPEFCYERVDVTDGRVAWCYRVTKWEGEPRQCEEGIEVKWVPLARLLEDSCTFREYNRGLFTALGLISA